MVTPGWRPSARDAADDRDAFAAFVAPWWDLMADHARALCPGGGWPDLLQDALGEAWRHRGRFDEECDADRDWLLAIVTEQAARRHAGPAGRDGAAPPLGVALDAVLARSRARRRWGVAGAAVVLVLAGVGYLASRPAGPARHVAQHHTPSRSPTATPTRGRTIDGLPLRRPGETLRHVADYGVDTVYRVPGRPRLLRAVLPYSRRPGTCSLFRPVVVATRQDAAQVRLRASGLAYVSDEPRVHDDPGISCDRGASRPVEVRLTAPLGARAVHGDAAGVTTARVLTPDLTPRPAYLPPGFRRGPSHLPDATVGRTTSERDYVHGDAVVTVAGGAPADLPIPIGPARTRTVIQHTVEADVYENTDENCIAWTTPDGRGRLVCASGDPVLGVDRLRAVAESVD